MDELKEPVEFEKALIGFGDKMSPTNKKEYKVKGTKIQINSNLMLKRTA